MSGDCILAFDFEGYLVRLLEYRAAVPGRVWGAPEDCFDEEPSEIEYEALDECGEQVQLDSLTEQRVLHAIGQRLAALAQQDATDWARMV